MPFKLIEASITPWKETLDNIIANREKNKVTILKTIHPVETRWYLHQALAAARHLSYAPYDKLDVIIKLRDTSQGKVLVVYPRVRPDNIKLEIISASTEQPIIFNGVSSLIALVSAVMTAKVNYLAFPDFEPSLIEKARTWAESMGHEITSTDPLTLKLYAASNDD